MYKIKVGLNDKTFLEYEDVKYWDFDYSKKEIHIRSEENENIINYFVRKKNITYIMVEEVR